MSATYGIASLVDGFVNGRNIKNGWQDRKDDKARQKRMDDLTFTQDARAEQEHNRRMRVYDENASDWDRARADDEAMRKAQQDAIDAANASMGVADATSVSTSSQATGDAAPSSDNSPHPVAGVAANLGIPMGAVPDRFAQNMPSPEALTQKYGPGPASSQGQKVAVRAENANVGAGASGSAVVPMGAIQEPEYNIYPGPRGAIADELGNQGPAGVRYIPNPKYKPSQESAQEDNGGRSLRKDAASLAGHIGDGAYAAASKTAESLRPVSEAMDTATRYFAGTNTVEDRARSSSDGIAPVYNDPAKRAQAVEYMKAREQGQMPGSITPELSAFGQGPRARPAADPMPAPTPSAPVAGPSNLGPRKASAQAAGQALSEIGTPAAESAVKAAADVAQSAPLGISPSEKAGAQQRDKFTGSFMDHYMKVGAPKVMEEFLRRGDFEKATKFQEFLDRGETREGMKNWAHAAFAASTGDLETFSDQILQAYNRLDYFPDGTTIVKDKSGIVYGKDGQPSGARVTFKDEASGNTWEKVYASPNDMVKEGISLLTPEAAFEHYAGQVAANTPVAKSIDPAQQQQDLDKRIDDVAKSIFEKSVGLDGQPTIPYEQARQQAAAALSGNQASPQQQIPPAPPPIAYRPTN